MYSKSKLLYFSTTWLMHHCRSFCTRRCTERASWRRTSATATRSSSPPRCSTYRSGRTDRRGRHSSSNWTREWWSRSNWLAIRSCRHRRQVLGRGWGIRTVGNSYLQFLTFDSVSNLMCTIAQVHSRTCLLSPCTLKNLPPEPLCIQGPTPEPLFIPRTCLQSPCISDIN